MALTDGLLSTEVFNDERSASSKKRSEEEADIGRTHGSRQIDRDISLQHVRPVGSPRRLNDKERSAQKVAIQASCTLILSCFSLPFLYTYQWKSILLWLPHPLL